MPQDIRKPLKKVVPGLLAARTQGLGEDETVALVTTVLKDVLGYDAGTEITQEKRTRTHFVDLALKLGATFPVLIEVVGAGIDLTVHHLTEARKAAARDNVSWILLTNGLAWTLYHVTLDEDLQIAVAFTVDLRRVGLDEAAEFLGLLHRTSVAQGGLEAFWEQRRRLGPNTLGRALFAPETLEHLRGELQAHAGIRVDHEVLAAAIHEMLRPDAQERVGAAAVTSPPAGRSPGRGGRRGSRADRNAPHVVQPGRDKTAPHVVEPPPDED
jgi:hypothetical protein